MFEIVHTGPDEADARLVAHTVLTPAEFCEIARQAGPGRHVRARKIGFVAARQAAKRQDVETRWNGAETRNTAEPGDWIVTNLTPERELLRDAEGQLNRWVIAQKSFGGLYVPAGGRGKGRLGAVYRATSLVEAIFFSGGFDILAPWGERQTAASGWLIRNGDAVYGNHADTFAATYEKVPG
jgi:hypothetical protein